jgi:hypothetical protein
MTFGRYFFGAKGFFNVKEMSDLEYINRMLDYVHDVHSLPESCAVEDEKLNQAGTYGPQWDRPSCNCKLYSYQHGGCPGPAAQRLPVGWHSGDDVTQ